MSYLTTETKFVHFYLLALKRQAHYPILKESIAKVSSFGIELICRSGHQFF